MNAMRTNKSAVRLRTFPKASRIEVAEDRGYLHSFMRSLLSTNWGKGALYPSAGFSTIEPDESPHVFFTFGKRQTTWKIFLRAFWDVLGTIDFTTIEVWTKGGLVTFYLLFVMEMATRRVSLHRLQRESERGTG
jgi:hypothetical protein